MTDRELKKPAETPRPRRAGGILVSSLHARGASSRNRSGGPEASDSFDDDGVDQLLGRTLDGGAEPRLLLVDQLLTRTRVRREV